ncbi:MAG: HAMP domain-containing protein [Chitinispirillaceae bacterium]|nr:HAMP domain-containing protein [Chitinispirillaceae bacterium]
MRPRKLVWQLYIIFILTMLVPAAMLAWYTTVSFRDFFLDNTVDGLTEQAHQIGSHMEGYIGNSDRQVIDSLCKVLAKGVPTRFTVIALDGTVLGDSERDPASMENHRNRMEIIAAFSGKTGISERFSHTLGQTMIYVAVPIYHNGTRSGIIRTSLSTAFIQRELTRMYRHIALGLFMLLLIAALVSYVVSRSISQPINIIKIGAQRFSSGDFSTKLPPAGCEEIDQLSAVLNEMAMHLRTSINGITEQRNRLSSVLSSMAEGVIAVDTEHRIIAINNAAVQLFGLKEVPGIGTWIGEVLRYTKINDYISDISDSGRERSGETIVVGDESDADTTERLLQLHGNALCDGEGKTIGVLVVINDVTRLKRLETMRSDFVANVSHELRTPLTSVKGFVETLLSGALEDKEESRRFLHIIARQVDRLSTIVEDLLALSRIEEEAQSHTPDFVVTSIADILDNVQQTCSAKAEAKKIVIERQCPDDLRASLEPALIEEALINLCDNAINYSPDNATVQLAVSADHQSNELTFQVTDHGPGIAAKYHERIFERFYRVDKARSRKLGGTGLGLSIVKHIAMVHGGSVSVRSAPGSGSTFIITIPLQRDNSKEVVE